MAEKPLTIAISSRALFDLVQSNEIYEAQGLEAYRRYQIDLEDTPLEPGGGYNFVKKILNINGLLKKHRVEVILLSRNSAETGLRIFNSIQAHELDITRAAFSGGDNPYKYIKAFGCDLFLSADSEDVAQALQQGVAAATLFAPAKPHTGQDPSHLKLAFDGDSVLFSDEAERIFQSGGLKAFSEAESEAADEPLSGGPFEGFLRSLHLLQQEFAGSACPIRTALVTARSAPAHERVIKTLRAWDVRLDESLFLGGMDKTAFLTAFGADVFFDDQPLNCERASDTLTAGHVPHGVINEGG